MSREVIAVPAGIARRAVLALLGLVTAVVARVLRWLAGLPFRALGRSARLAASVGRRAGSGTVELLARELRRVPRPAWWTVPAMVGSVLLVPVAAVGMVAAGWWLLYGGRLLAGRLADGRNSPESAGEQ